MENPVKYCTRCGTAMPAEAVFCSRCGAPAKKPAQPNQTLQPPPPQQPSASQPVAQRMSPPPSQPAPAPAPAPPPQAAPKASRSKRRAKRPQKTKKSTLDKVVRVVFFSFLIIITLGIADQFALTGYLFNQAKRAAEKKDLKRAVLLATASIVTDLYPDTKAGKLSYRGFLFLDLNEPGKALDDCNKAYALSENAYNMMEPTRNCTAEAYLKQGRYREALEMSPPHESFGTNGASILIHAKASEQLGDWYGAVEDYKSIANSIAAQYSVARRNRQKLPNKPNTPLKPIMKDMFLSVARLYAAHGMFKLMNIYTGRILKEIDKKDPDALYLHVKEDYMLGHTPEALICSTRFLKAHPGNADALYMTGIVQADLGKCDDAQEFAKALLSKPENYAKGLVVRGKARVCSKDYAPAIKDFDAALKKDSRLADAAIFAGDTLYRQSKFEAAIEKYDRAIGIDPMDIRPLIGATYANCWLGKTKAAKKYYELAQDIWPGYALIEHGNSRMSRDVKHFVNFDPLSFISAMETGGVNPILHMAIEFKIDSPEQIPETTEKFITTHRLTEKDVDFHIVRIFAALISRDVKTARASFNTLQEKAKPKNAEEALMVVQIAQSLGMYPTKLIELLDKNIARFPQDYYLIYYKGVLNYENINLLDAIDDFDKAIAMDPGDPNAYWRRANSKFYAGKCQGPEYYQMCEEALEDFKSAIAIDPENSQYHNDLGWTKVSMRKYRSSIEDFDAAIFLDPKNAFFLKNKCYALEQIESYGEAVKTCTAAIKIAPRFAWAYNIRGRCYISLNQNDKALKDFSKAISLDDSEAEFFINRGWLHMKLDKLADAEVDTIKASTLDPSNKSAMEQLVKIYMAKDEIPKAVEIEKMLDGMR